ncbi:unnamed protein product [Plutella xylostella]|uniref:(diamondback moth) hypothetical protein n=1 Tax=Plutella xylostella TaxID=51655 RepID=A0A8S4GE92_PLUXY|nr:unnamed protein product [Plutella xylostella]
MPVEWGNQLVLKLIELYESKGCLWDTNNREYKNKIKKYDAWEGLANELQIPRKDVEAKIHNLRSQFVREKKKIASSKGTGKARDEVIESSSWFAYDAMKFLLSGATTSGGTDTLEIQAQHQDTDTQYFELSSENTQNSIQWNPQATMEASPRPTSSKSSKKRMLQQEDKLGEAFDIMRSAKNKMEATPDEFDVYGRYVASELRLIKDEHSALMAKYYINNILTEARMGKYKQGYSTASTTPSEHQDSVTASNDNLYSIPRIVSPDPKQQRDFLKQLWFNLYSRGKGKISSSGFEHIFVSELKNGEVSGLHNWIYFGKEEAVNRINYLGYLKYSQLNDKGVVMKLHFNQQGVDKPVDTMFVGTSPELEIALYTLCFVTRADKDCRLKLGGKDVNIVSHTFRYRSKNLIGSAYPQI